MAGTGAPMNKIVFSPGDIIVPNLDAIFKFLLPEHKDNRCNTCHKKRSALKCCRGCRAVKYCHEQCQWKDWQNGHKIECKSACFRYCSQSWAKEEQMMLFRLHALLVSNPDAAARLYTMYDGSEINFDTLQSNEELWDSHERTRLLCEDLAFHLWPENPDVDTGYFVRLYGIIRTNALYMYDADILVGCCLYVQCTIFAHSCAPTARFSRFEGGGYEVRAIAHIPAGQRPSIAYVQTEKHMHPEDRRQMLLDRYLFYCHCTKCRTEKTSIPDYTRLNDLCSRMMSLMNDRKATHEDWGRAFNLHWDILGRLRRLYQEYDHSITMQIVHFAIFAARTGMCQRMVQILMEDARCHLLVMCGARSSVYIDFMRTFHVHVCRAC